MLKRTLFFSTGGNLSIKENLLRYESIDSVVGKHTFAIEDIGFIVIESQQMQITSYALNMLVENNVAIIICDASHMPSGQLVPYSANSLSAAVISSQLTASNALRGRLWKQTIQAKLKNQAKCLKRLNLEYKNIEVLSRAVKNEDRDNKEATGARFYFKQLGIMENFSRDRYGLPPNNALNYGYAILRAATARAIVGSGMLCINGIHHCNQYNAFALADDIMEPYRPFVDEVIFENRNFFCTDELRRDHKAKLLHLLTRDILISGERRPLANALSYTTASLAKCFLKKEKEIIYPEFT
ncbi:MAG: type II CRISPR-associated endonuclease Cas1 [Lentisphaeria bacterium]|nr:type II CRISPR-associated endonuclease Cas1 [Lentisphaeria bacterium]